MSEELLKIITPFITVLGSVIVLALSFYFNRKKQIEDDQRKLKSQVYEAFYDAIIEMGRDSSLSANKKAFSKSYNKLLFTGSDEVVASIIAWKSESDHKEGKAEFNSPLLKRAIDKMRKDLGLSRKPTIQESNFVPIGY